MHRTCGDEVEVINVVPKILSENVVYYQNVKDPGRKTLRGEDDHIDKWEKDDWR